MAGVQSVTEAFDEKDLRALIETNFWEALHLTREVVKIFREENPRFGSIGDVLFRSAAWLGECLFQEIQSITLGK